MADEQDEFGSLPVGDDTDEFGSLPVAPGKGDVVPPHAEPTPAAKPQPVSVGDAAAAGGLSGATLGWSDKVIGLAKAFGLGPIGTQPDPRALIDPSLTKDTSRAAFESENEALREQAKKDQPAAYGLSEAGAGMIPVLATGGGGLGAQALKGAAMGAVGGAAEGGAEGAVKGAAFGGVLGAGAKALPKLTGAAISTLGASQALGGDTRADQWHGAGVMAAPAVAAVGSARARQALDLSTRAAKATKGLEQRARLTAANGGTPVEEGVAPVDYDAKVRGEIGEAHREAFTRLSGLGQEKRLRGQLLAPDDAGLLDYLVDTREAANPAKLAFLAEYVQAKRAGPEALAEFIRTRADARRAADATRRQTLERDAASVPQEAVNAEMDVQRALARKNIATLRDLADVPDGRSLTAQMRRDKLTKLGRKTPGVGTLMEMKEIEPSGLDKYLAKTKGNASAQRSAGYTDPAAAEVLLSDLAAERAATGVLPTSWLPADAPQTAIVGAGTGISPDLIEWLRRKRGQP